MAFNPIPTYWIPSYAANATTLTVPIATGNANQVATDISAAEANATTGDIRQVYQGLCELMYKNYSEKMMTEANTADRPAKLVITKSVSVDPVANTTTLYYNATFICNTASVNVANES